MDISHSYEGVNGVNFRLVAQFFALSLLRRICESCCLTANSVFFRRARRLYLGESVESLSASSLSLLLQVLRQAV